MKRPWCWIVGLILASVPAWADDTAPSVDLVGRHAQAVAVSPLAELGPVPDHRSPECPGCPERHPGIAIVEAISINVFINLFDRVAHPTPEEFKVTLDSWWTNLKHGFVFDDNKFSTNQFAHPYHGSTYFNAGRANGLSYWESAPLAAMGSFLWECCGEKNNPAFNDFISTTMGGIAVGEVLHRLGLLVRDNQATGTGRFFREVGGLVVNPVAGVNRLATGDWFETRDNPPDRRPDYLGGQMDAGVIWRGEGGSLENTDTSGFVEVELMYGDPFHTRARKPFDQFMMNARFGGGKAISEFNLRGRLVGGHDGDGAAPPVFQVNQGFTYMTNPAYEIGGQSVESVLGWYRRLSPDLVLFGSANLAFVPLGAIGAEHVNFDGRTYDLGLGGGTGGRATLLGRDFVVAQLGYGLYYIHTVNGSGGEHIAQFITGRIGFPLFRGVGAGVSGGLYLRNSYYDSFPDTFHKHPELLGFVSGRID